MKLTDFKVGQQLVLIQPERERLGLNVWVDYTVTRVGRRWVSAVETEPADKYWVKPLRFLPYSMWADGGQHTSPGKFYLSLEDYLEEDAADLAWEDLRTFVNSRLRRNSLNAATIKRALNILKGSE